jgi:AcrR family transcriptional regulator
VHLIVDKSKEKTILPRVLRAAVELFVERGIDGTTIRDIAERAGVSEGALYRHFKSKDALAWNIFSTHLNEFSIELFGKVSQKSSIKDKIHAYILACFSAFEEDRDLFSYLIISEHRELRKFPASHMHAGHVALKMIEEGQSQGIIKPMDKYLAASILVGSVIRTCVVRMYGNIDQDLRSLAQPVAESLFEALKNE